MLGPLADADRADLPRAVAAGMEERGADRPIVEAEVARELPRGAIGKTPLLAAPEPGNG